MKARNRPKQINEILNIPDIGAEITTELNAYISDLEAKQPIRPPRIFELLEKVESHVSSEAKASLETYISELEASQQPVLIGKIAPTSESLYWHSVKREKERRLRAIRKKDSFQ